MPFRLPPLLLLFINLTEINNTKTFRFKLLLHHIIPGKFEIEQLQDEMTGVSLAGTQLRVNQYTQQDVEWNEIKVSVLSSP